MLWRSLQQKMRSGKKKALRISPRSAIQCSYKHRSTKLRSLQSKVFVTYKVIILKYKLFIFMTFTSFILNYYISFIHLIG